MSSNLTAGVFPPGTACLISGGSSCPITNDMVSFLNLTEVHKYLPAYCLQPPPDDGCPFGYCSNPDIAGPLVRISAYITNLCVGKPLTLSSIPGITAYFVAAILVFYHPNEIKESFWSQILTIYSLLITCGISIFQHQLTRIHAILATATAGSPLSLYIVVYATRSIWNGQNRLAAAVGPGQIIPRTIVLTALVVWIGLIVYIVLPSHLSDFAQQSCENRPTSDLPVVKDFFFLPIVIFIKIGTPWAQWMVLVPIQLTIFSWITAILCRRKEIWPPGERYTFRFWTVWRVISDNYPFIQFFSIVFIPFAYWVATIEVGVLASNDDYFSASFGQVLAVFVAVPPFIAVVKLAPRLFRWLPDLSWVRLLTCRPQRTRMPPSAIPLTLPGYIQRGYAPHKGGGDNAELKDPIGEFDRFLGNEAK